MFGDIVLAFKRLIRWFRELNTGRIKEMFCIHDYETRIRVIGLCSITQRTCKKCGRERFSK